MYYKTSFCVYFPSLRCHVLMGFSTPAVGHTHLYALSFVHVHAPFRLVLSPFVRLHTPPFLHVRTRHCSFISPTVRLLRVCVCMPPCSYAFAGSSSAYRPFRMYERTPVVRSHNPGSPYKRAPRPFATSQCIPDKLPRPRASILVCM